MNIVDLLIFIFLLVGIINGYRKGFFASLVGIVGSLIGLVVAYHNYASLTQWVNKQYGVIEILGGYFNKHLVLPQTVSQFRLDNISLPNLAAYLEKVDLPDSFHAQILVYLEKLQATLALPVSTGLGDIIHQFLATIIVNGIAFILIWFVVNMLINFIALTLTRLAKGTLLGGINHVGGMALGLVLTVLTLTILIGLISPLINLADLAEPSLFSVVLNSFSESKSVPYFVDLFAIVSEKIVNLLLL